MGQVVHAQTFTIDVVDYDDLHVLTLHGELDLVSVAELTGVFDQVVRSSVVVDLSRLQFIDAAGIGALVAAGKRIRDRGDTLQLANASEATRRVFRLCGCEDLLAD